MFKILIKPKNQIKADYDIKMILSPYGKSYYNLKNYSKPLSILVVYGEGGFTLSKRYIATSAPAEEILHEECDLYFFNEHHYDYRNHQIFLIFDTQKEYSKFKLSC